MLHHTVQLKLIINVHPDFLLPRFALCIFRYSEQFLAAGVDRNLFNTDDTPKVVFGNGYKKLTARTVGLGVKAQQRIRRERRLMTMTVGFWIPRLSSTISNDKDMASLSEAQVLGPLVVHQQAHLQ